MSKLQTLPKLLTKLKLLRRQGKKIVFTNGCFDLIHSGHIKVFQAAKKSGDILVLGLNSDLSVRQIKGKNRPIVDQESRVKVLEALEPIDYIVLFSQSTPYELIKAIAPDVLVKGGDWKASEIIGAQFAGKVKRIVLEKGKSTSALIEKILKVYGK